MTKHLRSSAYKKQRFILAHGFSPWSVSSIVFGPIASGWGGAHLTAASKQRVVSRANAIDLTHIPPGHTSYISPPPHSKAGW
jgi:hypothetical protein